MKLFSLVGVVIFRTFFFRTNVFVSKALSLVNVGVNESDVPFNFIFLAKLASVSAEPGEDG